MTTWHNSGTAKNQWADAPTDPELTELLDLARVQCEAFAPTLPDPEVIPIGYRLAQLAQARAIFTARQTGAGDTLGPEGQTVRVYPMDWQVKSYLRPTTGLPAIG